MDCDKNFKLTNNNSIGKYLSVDVKENVDSNCGIR